jgi:MFS transporter, DHA1 family, tetracycline resistance protein
VSATTSNPLQTHPKSPLPSISGASPTGRSPLGAIFFTIFVDLLGFGILLPVFPLLINPKSPYKITPAGWSFKESLIMLGWLQAIFPFCIFLASPILGQLSDRYGRKPVLAFSIGGTAVGYALFAVGIATKNLPLLFAARALDGLTGGNIAVAQASIGDISTNENRAKNFGLIGAAFGLGFIIGPYLGGRLSSPNTSFYGLFHTPSWFGATTPFWFATILSALNCLQIMFFLPETLKNKVRGGKLRLGQSFSNVIEGFKSPRLRVPLASAFWFNCGFTFFTSFFGIYVARKFGFTPSKTGDFFAIVGLFIAFSQAVLVGKIAKKLSDEKILKFSMFGQACVMVVYLLATSTLPIYLIIPVFTLFNGLTIANTTSLISRSADPGKQGAAMGISSGVQSLAQVPASALIGYITGSGSGAKTPLLFAAISIAVGGLVFNFFHKPIGSSQPWGTGAPGSGAPATAPASH